jgi:hypothetical protein
MSENNNNPVDNDKEKRAKAKAAAAASAEAEAKAQAEAKVNEALDNDTGMSVQQAGDYLDSLSAIPKEENNEMSTAQAGDYLSDLSVIPRGDTKMSVEQAGESLAGLSMFPEETKEDISDPMKALATSLGESYVDLGMKAFDQEKAAKEKEAVAETGATSKEEAAQKVLFQREFGTGLATLKAMQDPNYEIGSGSPLRQKARPIGPASGKFRRAARRLRRQGYGAAAQQMAMRGEMARMEEPSIDTPAARGQRMTQRIIAAREAQKQDKILTETERRAKEADARRMALQQPIRLRKEQVS